MTSHANLWPHIQYSRDIVSHESFPENGMPGSSYSAQNLHHHGGMSTQQWENKYMKGLEEANPMGRLNTLFVGDSIFDMMFSDGLDPDTIVDMGLKQSNFEPIDFSVKGEYLEHILWRLETLRQTWTRRNPGRPFPTMSYAVVFAGSNNITSLWGGNMHPGDGNSGRQVSDFVLGERGWAMHPLNHPNGNWRFTGQSCAKMLSRMIDVLRGLWPGINIVIVGFPYTNPASMSTVNGVEGTNTRNLHWRGAGFADWASIPANWKLPEPGKTGYLRISLDHAERRRRCNWQIHQMLQARGFPAGEVYFMHDFTQWQASDFDPNEASVGFDLGPYEREAQAGSPGNVYALKTFGGLHPSSNGNYKLYLAILNALYFVIHN